MAWPRRDLFRRVILPGALPSIFVGLRYALGVMWLTLIVAETIAAQSGIGYMAMQAREFMLIDVVVLSILIYALLGKLADVVARALERACLSLASGVPEGSDDPMTATFSKPKPRAVTRRRTRRLVAPGMSIAARGLGKSFGDKHVLHGLDLHVPAGQFLAIVGRSGCGKSTLLRLIAGLDSADAGRIAFDDGKAKTGAGRARDVPGAAAAALGDACSPMSRSGSAPNATRSRRAAPRLRGAAKRWASPTARTNGRQCFPAGRSSASRWRARWSAGRVCSRSTSRSARSTR